MPFLTFGARTTKKKRLVDDLIRITEYIIQQRLHPLKFMRFQDSTDIVHSIWHFITTTMSLDDSKYTN